MTEIVWLDGQMLPVPAAAVDLRCVRAVIAGQGVYETLRLENGCAANIDAHLQRLAEGAGRLELTMPGRGQLHTAVSEVAAANQLSAAARIRIDLARAVKGVTLALVSASALPLPAESQSLFTVPWRRNEYSPLAGIKYSACPDNEIAQQAAITSGCDEALFLNTRGHVCEGAYSNLFAVTGNTVLTPPLDSGCLPGITRGIVIQLCRGVGIVCEERELRPDKLFSDATSEMFLTSSIRGVMPVNRLDARTFPAERPITAALRTLYASRHFQQAAVPPR